MGISKGSLGGFCQLQNEVVLNSARTQSLNCGKKAKIGLWMYCVEEEVPWFPDGVGDGVEGTVLMFFY